MAEAVTSPDLEAWLVAAMRGAYSARGETAHAASKVPPTRPARMTRISLADTAELGPGHFQVSMLVECWASDGPAASALARTTYGLVRAMEGEETAGMFVSAVETVGGVAFFPDDTGAPRYQFTAQFTVAGELI